MLVEIVCDEDRRDPYECPHGNGLSCRDCDLEFEADDATWD